MSAAALQGIDVATPRRKWPRYPVYKPSDMKWLRRVPEHWRIMRLKNVASVRFSSVDKKSEEGETPVRLCNYTDVYNNDRIVDDPEFMKATAAADEIARFTLGNGDVLITKDSEAWNDIAVPAFVTADMPGVLCGYHLAQIRSRSTMLDGAYLSRAFTADGIRQQFHVAANGITRYGLPNRAIAGALFPVPPLDEQRAIAGFLDRETARIDELIAKKRRLVELLEVKRKAIIERVVTRGLSPKTSMKKADVGWLGTIPSHWKLYRIANLYRDVAEQGREEMPILSVSIHTGISDVQFSDDEMDRKVLRSEDKSKYLRVLPGDLVYNMMRAWQGGFGAARVEGLVSPAYVVARPKVPVSTQFVEHLLRTPNAVEEMRRNSYGVADFRLRLYWDQFKNIRVALPPLEEAEEICKHIESVSRSVNRVSDIISHTISTLRQLRSSLITAAVTGQIDVRKEAP